MKIYYARPISQYGNKQDVRDIQLLKNMGFDVFDPANDAELQEKYKTNGMDVFIKASAQCDGVAFRSFVDGKIGVGMWAEIEVAIQNNKLVIELPTITSNRILSVTDTREYLKLLGHR